MEGTMKFQCGDFFALRGYGPRSRFIRLLIFIRYGVPFKKTFSHVETAIDEKRNISAEAKGVMYVSNARKGIKKSDIIVFRFKKFNEQDQKKHKEAAEGHLTTKYAFARYALDASRIIRFVFIMFGWIFLIPGLLLNNFRLFIVLLIALVAFILFLTVIMEIAKKFDLLTEDCAENVSLIYSENKRWAPIPKERNEFPNGMVQVWRNLVLNEVAEVVARKKRGGEWEFKSAQDQAKMRKMILQKMI
jgi:hypothetical protein